MRKARARYLIPVAGFIALVSACAENTPDDAEHTRQVNQGLRERLTLEWVTDTLGRSPDDWLAAVQEVVDDAECYRPTDGSSCLVRVQVAEYLGGPVNRPATMREGWEYWNREMAMSVQWRHRRIGRRRLVLSVPIQE